MSDLIISLLGDPLVQHTKTGSFGYIPASAVITPGAYRKHR